MQGSLFTLASSLVHLVEDRAWWRSSRERFTEEVAMEPSVARAEWVLARRVLVSGGQARLGSRSGARET